MTRSIVWVFNRNLFITKTIQKLSVEILSKSCIFHYDEKFGKINKREIIMLRCLNKKGMLRER